MATWDERMRVLRMFVPDIAAQQQATMDDILGPLVIHNAADLPARGPGPEGGAESSAELPVAHPMGDGGANEGTGLPVVHSALGGVAELDPLALPRDLHRRLVAAGWIPPAPRRPAAARSPPRRRPALDLCQARDRQSRSRSRDPAVEPAARPSSPHSGGAQPWPPADGWKFVRVAPALGDIAAGPEGDAVDGVLYRDGVSFNPISDFYVGPKYCNRVAHAACIAADGKTFSGPHGDGTASSLAELMPAVPSGRRVTLQLNIPAPGMHGRTYAYIRPYGSIGCGLAVRLCAAGVHKLEIDNTEGGVLRVHCPPPHGGPTGVVIPMSAAEFRIGPAWDGAAVVCGVRVHGFPAPLSVVEIIAAD